MGTDCTWVSGNFGDHGHVLKSEYGDRRAASSVNVLELIELFLLKMGAS